MDPLVQSLDPAIKVGLVGPPRQTVDARRGVTREHKERSPEHRDAEMVEERGELLLLPLPCGFFRCLAAPRTRSSAWDTLSRSCARRVRC
jgi:hypothetical protein